MKHKYVFLMTLVTLNLTTHFAIAHNHDLNQKMVTEPKDKTTVNTEIITTVGAKIESKPEKSTITKLVQINGMVCAFCVDTLKKVFSKQKSVQSTDIDLDKKLLTLNLKSGQDLDESVIKKIVKSAGYSVVKITDQ